MAVVGPGRQQQDEPARGRPTSAAAASSASPVEMPTIGTPSSWASALAVAIPTRRPVNAPGPGPDDRRRRVRERRRSALAEQPPDRAAGAARRGGSRPPSVARRASVPSERRRRPRRPRLVAVSIARSQRPPRRRDARGAAVTRAGLEVAARVPGRAPRSVIVRGSSPVPLDRDVEPVGRQELAHPLRPLDERDARSPGARR